MKEKTINLNKDYLTSKEAQLYMGMSQTGFDRLVKRYNIPSSRPPGAKIVYRRSDLSQLAEMFFDQEAIRLA